MKLTCKPLRVLSYGGAASYDPNRPELANNGGNYPQPTIVVGNGNVTVTIDDCSCGDFGSRIYVEVEAFGLEYHATYGSMLHEDEEYSDIPEFMWPLIREVGQLTGYRRIPMRDGMPA